MALFGISAIAEEATLRGVKSAKTSLYDADPEHLWNRIHSTFMMRPAPDGLFYGGDRLEPLLWTESDYLLQGRAAEQAVAVLNELLRIGGERLIVDPVKRALLQRDLWLVASWLAGKDGRTAEQLEGLLARAIERLGLADEEIRKLPDNYRAAVDSRRFADSFDPGKPAQSFLPSNPFDPNGPWVSLGYGEGPTAPLHLSEDGSNRFTNSTFFVFLKLPGGRAATLTFLKELARNKPKLVVNPDAATKRQSPYSLPCDVPAWPRGTEVMLIRRALLINNQRKIVASPLTESVQLRVVVADAPASTKEILTHVNGGRYSNDHAGFEFRLQRKELFASQSGGLRDVTNDRDFKTGFNAHPFDQLALEDGVVDPKRQFPTQNLAPVVGQMCSNCHNYPGVYSFASMKGLVPPGRLLDPEETTTYLQRAHVPRPRSIAEVETAAVHTKQQQASWKTLSGFFMQPLPTQKKD
jgi:hypothetical protein